ncbi:MAG: MMPL family transporter [Actinocatenispora sp.]
MSELLNRLGRFAFRRHWLVAAVWLVVLVALLLLRAAFGGQFVNDYTVPGSEASQGADVLSARFPQQSGNTGQIVFHARTGTLAAHRDAVDKAVAQFGRLPHVVRAVSPFAQQNSPQVSKDGATAYANTAFDVVPASLDSSYLDRMNDAVRPARSAGLVVDYGGGAGQIAQENHDLRSELIGLTCALVLLLLTFGSLFAAAVPLVSALFSVGAGLSLVGLLAALSNVPNAAPTVATLLGLGVAVDYGLFMVARHREQLDEGASLMDSVGRAAATSGAAIVVAGGTVVIAILGLYLSGVPFIGSLGAASAIVVAVTMVAALTLIPALLGIVRGLVRGVGERRRRRHAEAPRATPERHEHSVFARWGRRVTRRPWPWAAASVVVLVVLALPVFSLQLGQLDASSNPTSDSSRRAYDLMSDAFGPGINGPMAVVAELPRKSQQANQQTLTSLRKSMQDTRGVKSVSAPSVNKAGDTAVLTVVPTTAPQDEATTQLVDRLRSGALAGTGLTTYLTGTTPGNVDFTARISQRMPWLIGAVVALAFILLTIAFRSLLIPAKAAVLNILSVGASYGVIVAVFQWQWGSGLVGVHESVPIPAFVPMLMFAIVFGLSMDYEVFLLSRVREAYLRTGHPHRSVAIGIGSSARVITTAAAIMIVVFISFVLDTDASIKMFAVGMAAAVLIDASVVRMVLVPALLSLFGRRAWWLPRWLDRVLPHVELEGSSGAGPAGYPPAAGPSTPER